MMTIRSYGKASKDAIEAFEVKLKFSLPEDYKGFLLEHNGGSASGIFHVNTINEDISLHVLFGLGEDKELDLRTWYAEYKDDMKSFTLIIGADMGTGLIVLLSSPRKQGVYYWDHSYYFKESSDERNIYKIANSFQEFVDGLKASDPI